MRKSRLAALLVVLIPMLFSIGFSAWIIVHEFVIQPVYQEYIDDYFGTSQTKTYTGGILLPDQIFPIDGDRFPESDLSYQFKLSSSSTWTNVVKDSTGPIDVGTYDIKVTVASLGETYDVTLIITPKKVSIDTTNNNNIISLNYDSAKRTFDSMKNDIVSGVKFIDETGNSIEIPSDQYDISGIQNGTFYYGSLPSRISTTKLSDTENSKVAGSIYEAYVTFTKGNYEFISSINDFVIFKYCTVKDIDSGSFTTLEDGIKGSLNMILEGDSTNVTSYIISCFSKITYVVKNYGSLNYSLKGNKVVVPYDSSGTDKISADPGGNSPVYSVLYIPENIILNVSNGSSVTVGAKIGFTNTPHQAAVGAHGVVMNHGTINVTSGCTYYSYGFTKGTGRINLYSGSSATDVFRTYDWPGGTQATKLAVLATSSNKVFPLTKWSVYNISCETRIYTNAMYYAFTTIYANSTYTDFTVTVIGNSSSSECLFRPTSSSIASDYILKYTEITNDSITTNNQSFDRITTIEVNGDYQDGKVTINAGFSISTSTSMATPISKMNIVLKSGCVLNISSASYLFMNNSILVAEKGSEININNSNAYFVFFNGSKLILNGLLKGSGKIGGYIDSTEIGAITTISTYSVSYRYMDASSQKASDTAYANGKFWENGVVVDHKNFNDVGTGVFVTNSNNSEGAVVFELGTTYYEYTINFYDKDESNQWILKDSDSIISLDTSYVIDKSYTSEPTKQFYEFDKWYTNQSLTNEFNSITLVNGTNNTCNLYANWNAKEYTFTYSFYYNDNTLSEDQVTITNKLEKFTINNFVDDILTISTQVSYSGKTFVGWYVGIKDIQSKIIYSSLSKANFSTLLESLGDATEIPLYCEFIDSKTVTFIHNCDGVTIDDAMVMVGETFIIDDYLKDFSNQLAIMNEKNSNILVDQYFTNNWYYWDSNSERVYVTELEITDNVVLYAEWEDKVTITMNYDFAYVNQSGVCDRLLYYYHPGQSFDINVLKSQINSDIPTGFALRDSTIYTDSGFSVSFSETTINASATYYAKLNLNVTLNVQVSGSNNTHTINLDNSSQNDSFSIGSNNSEISIVVNNYANGFLLGGKQTTYRLSYAGEYIEFKNNGDYFGTGSSTKAFSIDKNSTNLKNIIKMK